MGKRLGLGEGSSFATLDEVEVDVGRHVADDPEGGILEGEEACVPGAELFGAGPIDPEGFERAEPLATRTEPGLEDVGDLVDAASIELVANALARFVETTEVGLTQSLTELVEHTAQVDHRSVETEGSDGAVDGGRHGQRRVLEPQRQPPHEIGEPGSGQALVGAPDAEHQGTPGGCVGGKDVGREAADLGSDPTTRGRVRCRCGTRFSEAHGLPIGPAAL